MNNLTPYYALSEIEQEIGEVLTCNTSRQLKVTSPQFGNYSIAAERYTHFSVRHKTFQAAAHLVNVPILPEAPSLLMAFTLHGRAGLVGYNWEIPLEANQSIFNVVPVRHSTYRMLPYSTMHGLCVELDLNTHILNDFMEEDDNELAAILYRAIDKGESLHALSKVPGMDPPIWETLQAMLNCPYRGKLRELYLESQTKLMLIHQLERVYRLQSSRSVFTHEKLTTADVEKLQEMRLYLEEHFLEEHTLESLVRRFGMNLFKIKYGFKKLFGTSVIKWIDDKKLHHAHQLLLREDTTIFEVADQLSYQHCNNFSAAFKRKYGYSPQTLRKSQPVCFK